MPGRRTIGKPTITQDGLDLDLDYLRETRRYGDYIYAAPGTLSSAGLKNLPLSIWMTGPKADGESTHRHESTHPPIPGVFACRELLGPRLLGILRWKSRGQARMTNRAGIRQDPGNHSTRSGAPTEESLDGTVVSRCLPSRR